ncbi:MAG: (Fe-S)-binding protein [Candidatus Bipolaricaulia bacterium]
MLGEIRIERIMACMADPRKIRFRAALDEDIGELLPYLNAILPGAIYNHAGRSLTIRKDGRLITLYPRRIDGAKFEDERDAREVLDWLKEEIEYCFEHREELAAVDVYKLLPGSNCKRCGERTCLAFALRLVAEETSVLRCSPLFQAEHQEKRRELIRLLQAGGYPVPEAFAEEPI